MTVGLNTEVDLNVRIANLEIATFGAVGASSGSGSAGQQQVVNLSGSTDAVGIKAGTAFVTTAGVDAMTLANPVAGGPGTGDDGKTLTIYSTTAQAHTVTTAVHGIDGNKNIATFAGAIGDFIELRAFNGLWYMLAQLGITLSGS